MTARTDVPTGRGLRAAVAGGLTAACLAFGLAACSSATTENTVDQGAAATTAAVLSVQAPLNAVPTSGQDPADATDPGAQADPVVTGTPTAPSAAAEGTGDETTQAPVSTAGPIEPVGNIDQIVPDVPVITAPAVALTETADFGGQVSARIAQVSAVEATATLPGEVGGPAVAVTVEITNSAGEAIGLDAVTVTLADAGQNVAPSIAGSTAAPAAPVQGVLESGASKSGTYVFTVPQDRRNPVTVTVNYSAGAPTLVFTGAVAGG